MATYTTENYTNGARLRVTSDEPKWQSFTHKMPAGTAYATGDVIQFAKLGVGYSATAYAVATNASIAATTGNSLLKIGSTSLAGNIADFGGDDASVGGFCSADANVSAGGDALSLTLGTLGTAVSTGERTITLRVLVAKQETAAASEGTERVRYSSPYTL